LTNLIDNSAYADIVIEMKDRLRCWQEKTGDAAVVIV